MTSPQVDLLITALTLHGAYVRQPQLVVVDDVTFEFDAILRGPDDSEGLLIVLDCDHSLLPVALSRLRAFNLLLLRTQSMRSITLVIPLSLAAAPRFQELEEICRIVRVDTTSEATALRSLRPLLPLVLPTPEASQGDVARSFRAALSDVLITNSLANSLLTAGRKDELAVHSAVIAAIDSAIASATGPGDATR